MEPYPLVRKTGQQSSTVYGWTWLFILDIFCLFNNFINKWVPVGTILVFPSKSCTHKIKYRTISVFFRRRLPLQPFRRKSRTVDCDDEWLSIPHLLRFVCCCCLFLQLALVFFRENRLLLSSYGHAHVCERTIICENEWLHNSSKSLYFQQLYANMLKT